jgi:hypothetical protein
LLIHPFVCLKSHTICVSLILSWRVCRPKHGLSTIFLQGLAQLQQDYLLLSIGKEVIRAMARGVVRKLQRDEAFTLRSLVANLELT